MLKPLYFWANLLIPELLLGGLNHTKIYDSEGNAS